ncbi:hypothetical protein [Streptomyces sp.]|uniref:hypothetical protein n=1 Tax=Streptomyces sp. TaxID=1931 RepID=UPI00281223B3|nr:hypothetical protein [Streptomyces sp.]
MTVKPAVRTSGGLAALEDGPTRLAGTLEEVLTRWARDLGATALTLPPLLPVADLAALDVYRNFPQLALVSSTLDIAGHGSEGIERQADAGRFGPAVLAAADLALPSSACYGVYLHFRNRRTAPDGDLVSVMGQCFRNEDHYDGLRRLKAFRMREVVALGTPDQVADHLDRAARFLETLAEALGLPLERRAASDPFYDRSGSRAAFQRVVPVKHEYVYQGTAVASVNSHFVFFGERCAITTADGAVASTSCVGFGLERWLHALSDHFGGDWDKARQAVAEAGATLAPAA